MQDLILLHGALGSANEMAALRQKLEPFFRVHAPDFPGHGGSPMPGSFSIQGFAGFVKDYCNSQGLEKPCFFGYSMGGYVAMCFARKYPQLAGRIITLATKFHWDEAIAGREVKMLQPETMEQKVPRFAKALAEKHGPGSWKEVVERTAGMLAGLGRQNALNLSDYAEIGTPCLLMLGDRDRMVSVEETLSTYKALPHGSMAVLPGTPHAFEEVPLDLLATHIRSFL